GGVAAATGPTRFIVGDAHLGTSTAEQQVTQLGQTWMSVSSLSDSKDVDAGDIVLTKGWGDTMIEVFPGTRLEIETTLDDGTISYVRIPSGEGDPSESGELSLDPDGSSTWTLDNPDPDATALTTQHLFIDERVGSVQVIIYEK
ncbi:MAG: hypothetical protein M3Y46_07315, partial [Actinomycetota bacterium]|nr:hypothetical protein [Actinomycetota bacterium]